MFSETLNKLFGTFKIFFISPQTVFKSFIFLDCVRWIWTSIIIHKFLMVWTRSYYFSDINGPPGLNTNIQLFQNFVSIEDEYPRDFLKCVLIWLCCSTITRVGTVQACNPFTSFASGQIMASLELPNAFMIDCKYSSAKMCIASVNILKSF